MPEMKKPQPSLQQNSSDHLAANLGYAVPQNQSDYQSYHEAF